MYTFNSELGSNLDQGSDIVCGVDEAGRGPLAGPVMAAAVILNPRVVIAGLRDSKKLTVNQRQVLAHAICQHALAWSVAQCSEAEIDQLNIFQATLLAMKRAVNNLKFAPTLALIDGNRCPELEMSTQAVVKGDEKIEVISAASILAKTARDRLMIQYHEIYPNYFFDKHKGYPTSLHLEMLQKHGPCSIHRLSFSPVRKVYSGF